MQDIANILKISKSSVENHVHQLGYVNCFDIWVPHKLSKKKNLLDCISACDSLPKRNEKVSFLKQIVGTSLVAQWLRVHLPVQGTRFRALVWEDPTCRRATKRMCHNY